MADEVTESELCQTLRTFLPYGKFREVKTLLREGDVLKQAQEKYRDWLNTQSSLKSCEDDQTTESHGKEKIVAVFEKLVQCCEPVILDGDGWGKEEVIKYKNQASVVIKVCQVLLSSVFEDVNKIETGITLPLLPSSRNFVLKKVTCCLVSLCAANIDQHPWTSPESRDTAQELLSLICIHCQCSSIVELLCGYASDSVNQDASVDTQTLSTVFPSGLFRHMLDYLRHQLLKETWKQFPLSCHTLVWCTMQVKHPHVSHHFPKLMSPLLRFIDDYEVENKVLGLKCLKHVVDNMNSAELQWYGRADVLFEATHRHLYTSEPSLVRALHPCMLSILRVVEPVPTKAKFGRKTTKCDNTFQIVLTSMEFESKIAMRQVYASYLKDFIEHMGITVVRHFKRLVRVLVSYLDVSDFPEEKARLDILDALHTTMLHAWPRIPHHSSTILKSLLKLLINVTDSAPHLTTQAFQQLKVKISECLLVLLRCCGTQVEEQLSELSKGVGHQEVEDCAAKVLKVFEGEKRDSNKQDVT